MLSEQDITTKLETLGYKSGDIRMALRDVGGVIAIKVTAAYLAKLPEEEQKHIRSLSEEELQQYLAQRRDALPKMPQEEFEKIHDETWEDYFRSMS